MAHDAKYGKITAEHGDRVHGKPGVPLNESDEPVFVLRAQDVTSCAILRFYGEQSASYGASAEHLAAIKDVEFAFVMWQEAHPDLVKVPD